MYPANVVWAAAYAAHKKNNFKYIKSSLESKSLQPNLSIIKVYLQAYSLNPETTELTVEDFEMGNTIHEYICNLMPLILEDRAKGYIKAAVYAASLSEFDGAYLPLIASLPNFYFTTLERNKIKDYINSIAESCTTEPYKIGDTVAAKVKIIDGIYKKKVAYDGGNYTYNAIMDNHLFFFNSNKKIEIGQVISINGYVGNFFGNTIQLKSVIIVKGLHEKQK
jgi:hypothetical protein